MERCPEAWRSGAHWRRQDVAVDVAAGAERGAHGLDDAAKDGLQVVLEHAVELVALPRGQPQCPLPVLRQRARHRGMSVHSRKSDLPRLMLEGLINLRSCLHSALWPA